MSKDFNGFTFNGVKSEDLGIVRVSDGDRYNEDLHPEINDRTGEVSGRDGIYYFGTDYGAKPISVSFAYDKLTEEQFRQLSRVFSPKVQGKLIFDERPYKIYLAKVENPLEMEYVCFDEPFKYEGAERDGVRVQSRETRTETIIDEKTGEESEIIVTDVTREKVTPIIIDASRKQRIYKGEGTIEFTCHYPFAKSAFKILPTEEQYENVNEWAGASRILTSMEYEDGSYDKYVTKEDKGEVNLYNAGDISTGLRIYCPFGTNEYSNLTISYQVNNDIQFALVLKDINKVGKNDIGFLIDTEKRLIQGVSTFEIDEDGNASYKLNNNLYNRYIDAGAFFLIKPLSKNIEQKLIIKGGNEDMQFFYDYLYL